MQHTPEVEKKRLKRIVKVKERNGAKPSKALP